MRLKTLNQMIEKNENLLNFVTIPSDIADINETTLKLAIVRRCGDVEPYYQKDSDFQLFGALWFNSHHFLFSHAVALWNATYNPIENYDRTETETVNSSRTGERDNTDRHSGTDATTTSGTRDNTDTHSGTDATTTSGTRNNTDAHSGTDTTTRNLSDNTTASRETGISGFNSSNYSDANKEDSTETVTKTGTESTQHGETITTNETTSGTQSLQHGETITTAETTSGTESLLHGHTITSNGTNSEDSEVTRNARIHGNIGVTTAQQMAEAEIELMRRFWIYDYIASAFESDNFITVYKSYYDGAQFDDV